MGEKSNGPSSDENQGSIEEEKGDEEKCNITESVCSHQCGGCGSRRVVTICGRQQTITHEPCNLQVCMQSSVVSNIKAVSSSE